MPVGGNDAFMFTRAGENSPFMQKTTSDTAKMRSITAPITISTMAQTGRRPLATPLAAAVVAEEVEGVGSVGTVAELLELTESVLSLVDVPVTVGEVVDMTVVAVPTPVSVVFMPSEVEWDGFSCPINPMPPSVSRLPPSPSPNSNIIRGSGVFVLRSVSGHVADTSPSTSS